MRILCRYFVQGKGSTRCLSLNNSARNVPFGNSDGGPVNFDEMFSSNIRRARNSVLVRSRDFLSTHRLNKIFQPITGPIHSRQIISYRQTLDENKSCYFYLCELGRLNVDLISKQLGYSHPASLPIRTRIWSLINSSKNSGSDNMYNVYDEKISFSNLNSAILQEDSLDDQMRRLVDETELKSPGVAVRFFVASLMEDLLQGVFPLAACKPFGSTINGFGRRGGDLDMNFEWQDSSNVTQPASTNSDATKCLQMAHRRFLDTNDRKEIKKTLEIFTAMLSCMMPFCSEVQPIFPARVPIVKFKLSMCDVACDLTVNEPVSLEMAKVLWMYCQLDRRLKPLLFAVRLWAKSAGLTQTSPGQWVTNFQLVCLVIFFLQNRNSEWFHTEFKEPALPGINLLRSLAQNNDWYGLVSEPVRVPYHQWSSVLLLRSNCGPGQLLRDFFDFYGSFNFDRYAICLNSGRHIEKPDGMVHSSMCIMNPLDLTLNISKNVNLKNLQNFVHYCRLSLTIVKAAVKNSPSNPKIKGILPQLLNVSEHRTAESMEGGLFPHNEGTASVDRNDSEGRGASNRKKNSNSGEAINRRSRNFVGQSKVVLSDLLREGFGELDSLDKKVSGK